jgi:type I restriction enzyme S subunit
MNNQSILVENVPIDWVIKKIKYVFDERKETNDPIQTDVLVSLTHDRGVILHSEKGDIGNKEKDDIKKYKIVHPGDIVVNSMNVIIGSSGLSDHFGLVSPVYYMLVKKDSNHDNKFFHYLFRSIVFQKSLIGVGNGILEHRMRVPIDKLGGHLIPLPSANEQKLISQYLDKKTSQIDSLVEKIQKKIELLKEQRTSLINHYVTKGLDPNVEMKDSGVEWIGEIPQHWEVTPMFCLFTENKVKNKDGRLDVLTLSYGKIKFRDLSKLEGLLPETFDGYQVMEPQSIIIRSTDLQNDHKSLRVGHVGVDGVITSAYLGLNPIKDVDTKFYYYSIHSADLKKVLYGLGGGLRQSLRFDDFKRFPILNPPKRERDEISEKLDSIDLKTKNLLSKLEQRVVLLNEYRQSLISSVVTGKVRVTEDML